MSLAFATALASRRVDAIPEPEAAARPRDPSPPVIALPAGFTPPGTMPVAGVVGPDGRIAWCVPPADDDDIPFDAPTPAEIAADCQSIREQSPVLENRRVRLADGSEKTKRRRRRRGRYSYTKEQIQEMMVNPAGRQFFQRQNRFAEQRRRKTVKLRERVAELFETIKACQLCGAELTLNIGARNQALILNDDGLQCQRCRSGETRAVAEKQKREQARQAVERDPCMLPCRE